MNDPYCTLRAWWVRHLSDAMSKAWNDAMSDARSSANSSQVDLLWRMGEDLLGVTPPSRTAADGSYDLQGSNDLAYGPWFNNARPEHPEQWFERFA